MPRYREVLREEQNLRALPVLRAALALVRKGWCRGYLAVDARGYPVNEGAVAWSLHGAISEAGKGEIEGEYARRLLRRLLCEHNLPAWNDHPIRTRREVVALLLKAMRPGADANRGWRVGVEGMPLGSMP